MAHRLYKRAQQKHEQALQTWELEHNRGKYERAVASHASWLLQKECAERRSFSAFYAQSGSPFRAPSDSSWQPLRRRSSVHRVSQASRFPAPSISQKLIANH